MSLKTKTIALGLAAAFVVGGALPALAAPAFATSNVNVRDCGSTRCEVIDVLRRGDRVEIDYCEGSWCVIDRRGRDGWVSASYLERGGRFDDRDFYDDDDFVDDGFYIDRPRRGGSRVRVIRPVRPDFSACVGGSNARFCVYD